MSDNVITHDFGKDAREAGRKLSHLLGLVEAQRKELEDDPVRLFDLAGERIADVTRRLDAAWEALQPQVDWRPDDGSAPTPLRTVVVDARELERLRACAAIVTETATSIWKGTNSP